MKRPFSALSTRAPVVLAALTAVLLVPGQSAAESEPVALPRTGPAVPELASFDRIITELMRKHEIPGGAVAVAKDGRLLLARGYGLADVEGCRPVQPDALFRIASVSKPITAAAVLVLVERGRLDLDAKVVDLLASLRPQAGRQVDPRFCEITVRQLLHHTGGFDRGKSFDPMFGPPVMTEAHGAPLEAPTIVRFMWGRPLDFPPGTRYAYSNFGYCLLGRVIEEVTGEAYEESVQALVLRPMGITRMRLGRTRREQAAAAEVCYYPPAGAQPVASVFPEQKQRVTVPYGGFYLEAMDAHGGWIASAVDLVRFATRLAGDGTPGLLKPRTIRWIASRPAAPVSEGEPAYYGLGWSIRPVGGSANWWHTGSLPGTSSLLVRTHHGLVWAAVFNRRPRHGDDFCGQLDQALWRAAGEVKTWPEHDLFNHFR
ncbi:MAG: beta-lactamase family protein [Pirellulales bacterium]|nr:beta-lactamase family protein [Pirellulales bacterium]